MTNGNLALFGLGATRRGLGGLSATVPGLRQCHICKWPEIQSELLFGPAAPPPPVSSTKFWIRVGGVWKETTVYIRIGGVWKVATPAINVTGTWR